MKIFRISDFIMAGSWLLAFILSLPLIEPLALSRLGAIGCMGVFAATGLGRGLAGPGIPASRSFVFWMLPALWLLALASVAWSPSPFDSFIAFATLGLLVLGFVVFATSRGMFRALIPLAPGVLLVLWALGLWAIIQYLFFPGMLVNGQVRAPFANPNNYASLLMLGLFPVIGVALSASRRPVVWTALVVAAVLVMAIALIGGRSVLALTIVGLIVMAVLCRGRARAQWKSLSLIAVAALVGIVLPYLLSAGRAGPVPGRASLLLDPAQPTIQSRLALWKSTWAMIRDHGMLGTGYGTYFLFYPQYRTAGDTTSAGLMAHNDLLQLWAETGIAAPLLMLALYAGAIWRTGRVLRRCNAGSGERALCLAMFLGAGLVALNGLINFDFYTAPILCLLGLVLGLWFRYSGLALGDKALQVQLPRTVPRSAGWAIVCLPLLLIVFVTQGFLFSTYHASKAEQALGREDWTDFQQELNRSRHAGFDRNARPYVLAANIPIGILEAKGESLSAATRTELADHADFLLSSAEARNTRLVGVLYDRAVLARYGLDKGSGNARSWLGQALVLDPGHFPSRMLLAELDMRANEPDRALQVLTDGLDVMPLLTDPVPFYRMAADIAHKQGHAYIEEKALRKLKQWQRDPVMVSVPIEEWEEQMRPD